MSTKDFNFGDSSAALNNLLGSDNVVKAVKIPINHLRPWKGQPFEAYSSDKLIGLKESIEAEGLLHYPVVRKVAENVYEILSGHNRINACKLLEWVEIPCYVRENLTDEEAELILIDSNLLQRQKLSPKEKVLAYSRLFELNKNLRQASSSTYPESVRSIQRYYHMSKLTEDWLDKLNQKRVSLGVAYEIAWLSWTNQENLANYLDNYSVKITKEHMVKIVALNMLEQNGDNHVITDEEFDEIFNKEDQVEDKTELLVTQYISEISSKELPTRMSSEELERWVRFLVKEKIITK